VTRDAAAGMAKGRARGARSPRTPLGFWGLGVATGAVLGIALPTGLLLAVGLIPAATALALDRSPTRATARTVTALNLAGLLPALRALWLEGHTLMTLAAVLARVETLPLAYAAALIGFLLPQVLSWAVLAVLEARAYGTTQALEQRRAALREIWGPEVDRASG
jgi:hypothetical protein